MAAKSVPQGAAFAFEVAQRALDEQLKRIDALDSKAGILLAADGIIIGVVIGREWFATEAPTWVAVGTAVPVLLSLAAALIASLNRNYLIAPEPGIVAHLADAPADWIRWRLIANILAAVDGNRRKLRRKARVLTFGQFALLVGLGLFGGYFIGESLAGGS